MKNAIGAGGDGHDINEPDSNDLTAAGKPQHCRLICHIVKSNESVSLDVEMQTPSGGVRL